MPKRICVFGDSIVWGANDFKNGGWVDKFKIYFSKTGQFNEVFNLRNPGNDTHGLLNRIKNESATRMKPEYKEVNIIIFQIGINDSQYLTSERCNRIFIDDFKKNIQKIIGISKKIVRNVVIVGLTPVNDLKTTIYKNKYIKKYNDVIKGICEENNLPFIEMFDLLKDEDLEDGLHPNAQGHEKMFQNVKDFLMENKII